LDPLLPRDRLPRLRREDLDFLMVPLFRWDLLFPMVQHLHLFPVVLDYRMVPLFRMLRVVHFRQQVLKDRLHRRDPLPRLRREVLGHRKDLQLHLDLLRRMDPAIRFHLLFLMLPVIRWVRLLL